MQSVRHDRARTHQVQACCFPARTRRRNGVLIVVDDSGSAVGVFFDSRLC